MARGDGLGSSARVEKGRERLGCLLNAIETRVVGETKRYEMSALLNYPNVWMTIRFDIESVCRRPRGLWYPISNLGSCFG